jgi:hypothetical protein
MTKLKHTGKDPFNTMLTITAGFIAVYFFTKAEVALVISLVIGITGMASPRLSMTVHRLWWMLAWVLSLVVPKIVLTVIYFIILVPVSTLARWSGRSDLLRLKNVPGSAYRIRNFAFDRTSFEKPW